MPTTSLLVVVPVYRTVEDISRTTIHTLEIGLLERTDRALSVLNFSTVCSYFVVDLLHVHDMKNYRAEYQTYADYTWQIDHMFSKCSIEND